MPTAGLEPVGSHEPDAPIREHLSGGDPRTLRGVDAVVALVLAEPGRSDELARCILEGDDEIVRMRAADALEKVARARPALLRPHAAQLLGGMSTIEQPSVQWHVAQMLGRVSLDSRERSRAARILCRHLDTSSDWLVLNCSLATMAALAREDPGLVEPLVGYLRRLESSSLKSVSSRARKLLAEFGP